MKRNLSLLAGKKTADLASIATLVLLTLVVFRDYLSGQRSPSWDFLGDYLTNAISWWNLGSFFSPAIYIPYAFSGYPAYLSAQSSGWYFPYVFLDVFNLISSYPLAVLQVLTIIFGVVGFYFFSKSWNVKPIISLTVSIGYLFTPGFFTSASHIDIVRAWAFMPWLLLALKPKEKNSSVNIALTGLLSFQYLIGIYPGVIIASVYIFALYIPLLIWMFRPNLKKYFTFQLLPLAAGALLALIKWLPFVFEERLFRGGNTVVVNQGILSTLLYPYQTTILPNDITMRSLFIMPILVVSLTLINKITKPIIFFSSVAVFSIVLGFDFSQSSPWQNSLPLLGESRFRTTDFKLFLTIAILMLSAFAIQQALEKGLSLLHAGASLTVAFGYFWLLNRFAKNGGLLADVLGPGNLMARFVGITFLFIILILLLRKLINLRFLTLITNAILILNVTFAGWYWSAQSPAVWSNDRVAAEQFYYGETSSEINKRVKDYEPSFREERSGPTFPIPYPAELTFQTWNKSEIDKSFTLGGLVSLKGVTRYEDLLEIAMSKDGVEYFELLRQPLSAWVVDKEQANLETAKCIIDNSCTNLNVNSKVTNWKPSRYSIELSDAASGLLVTNEVAWAGWHAKVCSTSSCSIIPVASDLGNKLVAVQITDNVNSVEFFYKQPYKTESWVGFSIGVSLLLFLVVINNKSRKNLVYK